MTEIGKAWIDAELRTDRVPGQARDALNDPSVGKAADGAGQQTGSRFSDGFKSTLRIGAAVGAGLAAAFVGQSINAAADYGETVSKVGQILGDTGGDAVQWAEANANAMGQTRTQALDAIATFSLFGSSAGLAGDDLLGFSSEMTTLASDLASFNNTDPQQAIDAIGAALRGESEPIRQFGVLLDEATLKARALELGLISTTTQALTPQQKVLAAQAEIMAQTTKAQGDFARTSAGLPNTTRILKAEFTDLQVRIGSKLLPAVLSLVQGFKGFIGFVNDNRTPFIAALVGVGVALTYWGVTAAATAVQNFVFAGSMLAAALPIIAIGVAVAALTAGVIWAYQNVEWFRTAVDAVGSFLRDKVWPIVQTGATIIGVVLVAAVKGVAGFFTGVLIPAVSAVIGWFGTLIVKASEVAGTVKAGFDTLVGFVKGLPGRITSAASGMFDGIKTAFKSAVNWIIDKWNGLEFTIGGGSFLGQDIPSATLGTPNISKFHEGGIVPGKLGDEVLAWVQAGETIRTPQQESALRRGGIHIENFHAADRPLLEELSELEARYGILV